MKKVFTPILFFLLSFSLLSQERGIGLRENGRPSLQSFYRESWALVVGINDYLRAPKLRYAVNDAKAIVDILVNSYGFKRDNVIELYDKDATKENILRAFDRLRQLSSEEDRVFIFFAGHGITEVLLDGRERGFILPYEGSKAEVLTTAISTDQLNEISLFIKAKHLFIVMDACYGGLIFARAQPISAEALDYVKIISTRVARKALTAGGRDQPVFDTGPGGHSIFTYYFVDGLKTMSADLNQDGIITTSELMDYVGPRVTAESKGAQTPEYGVLLGDKGGDFVFIPVGVVDVSMVDIGVDILSQPEGADVFIGGNFVGKTPVSVKLRQGDYLVEVSKPGYRKSVRKVSVKYGAENKFNFVLEEFFVNLDIVSSSKSGTVYIDDSRYGSLVNGRLAVKVKPGGRVIRIEGVEEIGGAIVDIPEVENFSVFVDVIPKLVEMTIASDVDGADVYIDSVRVGRVSGNKFTLALKPGKHLVELRKEGYAPVKKEISISSGEVKEAKFELLKPVFSVNVKTEPSDAVVYANDKLLGKGSFRADVDAGKVKFRVEREGYETIEKEVVVNRDNLELEFVLKPIKIRTWVKTSLGTSSILSVAFEGNYVWLGTTEGLVKLNRLTGERVKYDRANSGLPSNYVRAIVIDRQGNKWIGTSGGFVRFDGTNWTVYNTLNSGLPSNNVYAIAIDGQGNKWIGTSEGLAKFDGVNWSVANTSNSGLPNNYVFAIAIDGQGNKWVGTGGGLSRFDGVRWIVYKTSNSGLPSDYVEDIVIDSEGNKWIGTNGGLSRFDGVRWIVYKTSNSGLPSDYVYTIAIDSQGNKWIGTNEGLARFDGVGWAAYKTSSLGFPSDNVYVIAIDSEGTKWIGTNGGVAVYRESGLKPFLKPYAYFYSNKLDFGKLRLGGVNRLSLKVSNDGGSELRITDVSVRSSSFKFLNKLPMVLNPGDSVNLSFEFSPSFPGSHVDTVFVYSNSYPDSVFKVILTGSAERGIDVGVNIEEKIKEIMQGSGKDVFVALGFGLLLVLLVLILASG